MALKVCMCGSVCLSQIKYNNLTQYLTNKISSTTDTIITPRNLFLTHTHLALLLLSFFSPPFLPVLHAPMCFDYWLCVCVFGNGAGWALLWGEEEGSQMGLVKSLYIWLCSCPSLRTHTKTSGFMFGILSLSRSCFCKNTYMCI